MPGSSRNRVAGHNWERDIVKLLNDYKLFPKVGTSRHLSSYYDAKKIDILTEDLTKFDKLGLAIQAKSNTITVPYPKLLSQLKETIDSNHLNVIPIVFHKQTERVNNRFMPRETYVSLLMKDFLDIYVERERYKRAYTILMDYFDFIPDDEKKIVNKKLTKLNL